MVIISISKIKVPKPPTRVQIQNTGPAQNSKELKKSRGSTLGIMASKKTRNSENKR